MEGPGQILVMGAALGFLAWTLMHRNDATDAETGETDNSADVLDLGNQVIDYGSAIFDESNDMTAQANLSAFLAAIRLGEGTSSANGYSILCGGGTFDDYSAHPALAGWRGWQMPLEMARKAGYPNGAVSTAAGAFQINRPTYKRLADKLGLDDFSPNTQDRMAIELIREKGALGDVLAGRAEAAAGKVAKVWASMPGATYGQRTVSMQSFLNQYSQAGGQFA